MAGEWIKFESVTPDKPEVYQMAERLGIDPDAVVGKLVRVWVWADQQTIDGNARGVTRALLDRITSATGFAEALIAVGWLDESDAGLTFPRFGEHNGTSAKKRSLSAKRSAKARKSRAERDEIATESVTSAPPREEKSREEKSIKKTPPPPQSGSNVAGVGPVILTEIDSGGDGLNLVEESKPRPGDEWQTLTNELTGVGLTMAAEAARWAKKNGATPGHCRAVLEHWRSHPGAWSVGIIYSRFKDPALCNMPPAKGWPTPAARVITTNSAAEAKERQAEQFAEIDEGRKRADATRRELDQLAEEHGDAIDRLSPEKILELLPGGPARSTFETRGWRAPTIRGRVLRVYVEKYLAQPITT